MSQVRFSRPTYSWGPKRTCVMCPGCKGGELELRFSCLSTRFVCPSCAGAFQLADLVDQVDDDQFEILSGYVGDRHSDRVG